MKLAKKLKKEKVQMDIIFLRASRGEHGGARAHHRDAQRKVSIVIPPVFYSQSLSSSCFSSVFIRHVIWENGAIWPCSGWDFWSIFQYLVHELPIGSRSLRPPDMFHFRLSVGLRYRVVFGVKNWWRFLIYEKHVIRCEIACWSRKTSCFYG